MGLLRDGGWPWIHSPSRHCVSCMDNKTCIQVLLGYNISVRRLSRRISLYIPARELYVQDSGA